MNVISSLPTRKSAQKLDADIMLVLQDWASDEYFQKRVDPDPVLIAKGHDPTRPTNKNLKKLLQAHFGIQLEQTYATNLFPFIKLGKMSGRVRGAAFADAAETYTVPEIKLVEPKLVVCCGSAVSRVILEARGFLWPGSIGKAIESSPYRFGDTEYWAQSHPGGQGTANRGGFDHVSQDWERMSAKFRRH